MIPPAGETLATRTTRAAKWRGASAFLSAAAQFVLGVVLARLLPPADFGIVALATVVLGFVRPIGDLGIGNAIIQRASLNKRHVQAAFAFSVMIGTAYAAILWAAAPLAAVVVDDPAVTPIVRALAIGFAIGGAGVVAGALLRRELEFKKQFFIEAGSHLLGYGAVAITLAVLGFGPWSLVAGGLMQGLLATAGSLAVVRHPLALAVHWTELRELLHFGIGSTLTGAVNYVALNGDNFIVGRSLGTASLGLYSRAYTLMNLPFTYAASVLSSVLFPAIARAQGDRARVRRAYLLMVRATAMIAGPVMVMLVVTAPHLVPALFGPRWNGVVAPLQILAAAGYCRALYHVGGIVAQSLGFIYRELANQVLYAAIVVGGSLIGLRFGLPGVAGGVAVAIVCMFGATSRLALTATGTSWRDYVRVQTPGLVVAVLAAILSFLARAVLERLDTPQPLIVAGCVLAAAVPWSLGILRMLGEPEFADLEHQLSRWPVEIGRRLRSR